jgi:hypothetical protein
MSPSVGIQFGRKSTAHLISVKSRPRKRRDLMITGNYFGATPQVNIGGMIAQTNPAASTASSQTGSRSRTDLAGAPHRHAASRQAPDRDPPRLLAGSSNLRGDGHRVVLEPGDEALKCGPVGGHPPSRFLLVSPHEQPM